MVIATITNSFKYFYITQTVRQKQITKFQPFDLLQAWRSKF